MHTFIYNFIAIKSQYVGKPLLFWNMTQCLQLKQIKFVQTYLKSLFIWNYALLAIIIKNFSRILRTAQCCFHTKEGPVLHVKIIKKQYLRTAPLKHFENILISKPLNTFVIFLTAGHVIRNDRILIFKFNMLDLGFGFYFWFVFCYYF